MAHKCSVDFEKFFAQCNNIEILVMLAENDAPKIQEQNAQLVSKMSSNNLLEVKVKKKKISFKSPHPVNFIF